jgi:hypothetical protein
VVDLLFNTLDPMYIDYYGIALFKGGTLCLIGPPDPCPYDAALYTLLFSSS